MAKRVNKSFLIAITAVFVGIAVALVAAKLLTGRKNAPEMAARAEAARQSGDLKLAREYYTRARNAAPSNLEYRLALGDVLRVLAREDRDVIGHDVQEWRGALEMDPNFVPARRRVLDAYVEYATGVRPDAETFKAVVDQAQALAKADPSDLRAKAWEHAGALGAWLSGGIASEEQIKEHVDAVAELADKDFQAPQAFDYAARALLRQAMERDRLGDAPGAEGYRKRADELYDAVIKARPKDPRVLLQYSQYLALSSLRDNSAAGAEAAAAQRAEVVARARDFARQASELVKPGDSGFADVRLRYADVLNQEGKRDEAITAVRTVLDTLPESQRARIQLAGLLKLDNLDKAVELLDKPLGDDPELVGYKAVLRRQYELERLVELTELRMEQYRRAGDDAAKKTSLRAKVDESYAQAAQIISPDSAPLLKLKARVLLLEENLTSRREAIRLMQKALERFQQQRQTDPDLLYTLAQSYRAVNEPGQARDLLVRLTELRPQSVQPRKDLVQLLVTMNRADEAVRHIEALEKLAPEDPQVKQLRLALFAYTGDSARAAEMAKGMPEGTQREKLAKAAALIASAEHAAAESLLVPMSMEEREGKAPTTQSGGANDHVATADPATRMLVHYYMRAGKKDQARPLIAAMRVKLPTDAGWKRYELALNEKIGPEELRQLRELQLETVQDPVERALMKYNALIEQNKLDEAIAGLVAEEKAQAEQATSWRIVEAAFNFYVGTRQFGPAQNYAARLAQLNVDQADGLYYLARLSLERREFDAALRHAKDLTVRVPEFAKNWLLLAQVQQASSLFEAAAGSYARVLDKMPENVEAIRGMVECQLMLRQVQVAQRYIDDGLRLSGNSPYFREMKRRVEEMFGDPLAVTAEREKEAAANPESVAHVAALLDNYFRAVDVSNSRNDKEAAAQFIARAKAKIDEALAKWPDELAPYRKLSDWSFRATRPQDAVGVLEQFRAREKWKARIEPDALLAEHYRRMGGDHAARVESVLQQGIADAADDKDRNALRQRLVAFHQQRKDHDKAIQVLTALYESTKDPAVQRQMVDVHLSADKPADADKVLDLALAATPRDPKLISQKALIRIRQGDFAAATPLLVQALSIDPQYAPAHYYRGVIKLSGKDVDNAVLDMERARDLSPSNVEMRIGLADAYFQRNEVETAVRELETALQLAPQRTDVRTRLLDQYFSQRRWGAVESLLEQAKADPELGQDPSWWQRESKMWMERGNLEKSRQAIARAVEASPADPNVLRDFIQLLIASKDYAGVIRSTGHLEGVKDTERPYWVHTFRAEAFKNLGDKESMVRELDRALSAADATSDDTAVDELSKQLVEAFGLKETINRLRPRAQPRWALGLLGILVTHGELSTAVEVADELVNKTYADLSDNLKRQALRLSAVAYHQAFSSGIPGAYDKAISSYKKYGELAEGGPAGPLIELNNNLASLLIERPAGPDAVEALKYSQKAFDLQNAANQDNPAVVDTHAWVLVLGGKVDEGINLLLRASNGNNPPADVFYHLGEAYLMKNQPEDASIHLRRAKTIYDEARQRGMLVDPAMGGKIDRAIERASQSVQKPAAKP